MPQLSKLIQVSLQLFFFALEMILLIANFRRRLSMSNFHHRNKWDKIEQHKIKIIVAAHKSHRKINKRIYITRCIYVPEKLAGTV